MTLSYFLSLILFSFATTITPGPNILMVTASGAAFGLRRTLPHILGIAVGFSVIALAVAAGLGAVFERWPVMHRVLQGLGAAYLLFLAWKIYRAGQMHVQASDAKPLTFLQAALFQWVNPKAWTMAITALAAFTLPPPYHIGSAGIVVAVFFLMCLPCSAFWTLLGQTLVLWLKSDRARQWFNSVLAALTVASVVLIFI
ncbi:MAG: LysE family translocator [Natronospirillum sp.]